MKINSNTLFIILSACIIAAGAFWYFFMDAATQPPLSLSTSGNQSQVRFQTLVAELQPISFNANIFSDPRFLALRDLTTPITDEPIGRSDPFAAAAGVSARQ